MGLFVNPITFQNDTKGRTMPYASYDFYETDTYNRKATYSDIGLTSVNPNPVIADGAGKFPPIYLDDKNSYRVVFSEFSRPDVYTQVWERDGVTSGLDVTSGLTSIDSVADLFGLTGVDGQQISVGECQPSTSVGGGKFAWDQGVHDGGTFIDPTRTFPTPAEWANGLTDPAVIAWFDTSGGTVNGWERLGVEYVTPEMFGLNTLDELQALIETTLPDLKFKPFSRLELRNSRESSEGLFDAPNFAGQTDYGNEPIGFIFHHYTDGGMIQIDNVGESNDIIRLKNAQNANRRPDKPSSFVGSGNFLAFDEHDDSLGFSQRLGFIDKAFKIVWTGVKGIATLWQNKADDGTPAFRLQTTNNHDYILNILNGLTTNVFNFRNDVTYTRARIDSHPDQTNGMYINAGAGNLVLDSTSQVRVNKPLSTSSGNLQLTTGDASPVESLLPLKLRQYSTAALPSAATYSGCVVSISDRAGKPSPVVYSDGAAWYYMDNTAV
jgi:hypothetical protein